MRSRFSCLSAYITLFALGMTAVTAPVAAAPQNQTSSDLSIRTTKTPDSTASIKPAAQRPAPTRQNWGTVWTGYIDDPNANVNPCQKGLERGEQLQVKTYKSGDTTRYDVNYQCYLLVPAPRPAVASAIPRKNCGTAWTGWIDDPDAEVNPCSKGCEPGEQQIVDAGINGGVKQYNVRYQCYVAGAAPKMATGSTPGTQEQPITLTTSPLRMTGKRLTAVAVPQAGKLTEQPITLTTPPLRMTGKRLATVAVPPSAMLAEQPITLTTPPLRMTGKRLATFAVQPSAMLVEQPITLTTPPLRMTGKRPPVMTFGSTPMKATDRVLQTRP